MTTEIQQSFKEILTEIAWLDDDTRKLAVEKIDAMRLRIGYPDFILDRKQLAKRYYDICVDPELYFENTLSILKVSKFIPGEMNRHGPDSIMSVAEWILVVSYRAESSAFADTYRTESCPFILPATSKNFVSVFFVTF